MIVKTKISIKLLFEVCEACENAVDERLYLKCKCRLRVLYDDVTAFKRFSENKFSIEFIFISLVFIAELFTLSSNYIVWIVDSPIIFINSQKICFGNDDRKFSAERFWGEKLLIYFYLLLNQSTRFRDRFTSLRVAQMLLKSCHWDVYECLRCIYGNPRPETFWVNIATQWVN